MHEEISVLLSPDQCGRIAVVRRSDGLFCLYEHWHWSVEAQTAMRIEPAEDRIWSTDYDPAIYKDKEPLPGLYGTLADAENEARSRLRLDDS
jgi:hypothetical protein